MAAEEEEDGCGIPEWIVTFGDMMSLLLTFFIMLVSLSEIKERKYQALQEAVRKQFGLEDTRVSAIPGKSKPRNSRLSKLASAGRSGRHGMMKGGNPVKAPTGDHQRVRVVRPGSNKAVGTVITFAEGSAELLEAQKRDLQRQALEFSKQMQKIEIRGHTSLRPTAEDSRYQDNWDLAYERCRKTMEFLVSIGIQSNRFRMAVAGQQEPYYSGTDTEMLRQNARVEVFLIEDRVVGAASLEDESG